MNEKPLYGVKVLDFGQHGAGSACGKTLSDWGADVIKVEPFRGCGSRAAGLGLNLSIDPSDNIHHEMINSGKRGIAVNVKTPEGAQILDRLLSKADIFFSNYRLGALKKLGLDYETLSVKYPRLICGYLTAYGPVGPKVNDPGFDSVAYWAYSGITLDCGTKENGPFMTTPFGGGDMMTGMTLAAGLAACLYKQVTTGKGEVVYTSLFGTGCWQASCMIQASVTGSVQYPRSINSLRSPISNFFRTKDGEWFLTAVMDFVHQGPLIAHMVGHDELGDIFSDPAKMDEDSETYLEMMRQFFIQYTWPEIDQMLTKIDLVHGLLQRTSEMWHNEQALENHYIYDATTRSGKKMPIISTPVQFGDRIPLPFRNAPLIGEHTREVLAEYGYTPAEIENLFEKNVIMETR